MEINDLYKIIEKENGNSEIIAMSIVVRDLKSGELTSYFVDEYDGLCDKKI